MNTDMQTNVTNPESRQLNVCNPQIAVIGDNNIINLPRAEEQENDTGNSDRRHKKVASGLPGQPFHVSRERKKELKDIDSLFSGMTRDGSHVNVVRTVYLTGPPGAGKTQLARQYAERFLKTTSGSGKSTPLVITLNANSKESLLSSVKDVARNLQFLVDMELTNKNLMDKLRDYLHDCNGTWLLIVDDMFQNSGINDLFPPAGSKEWGDGLVLVTTQDGNVVPACHEFAKKYSVEEGMTKDDALALLTKISGVEADDFAEEIVEVLHYLPLALACCATYVGETRQDRPLIKFGWKDYLNLYRESGHLESRTFSNNNCVYRFSMATAAAMAVDRMEKNSDVLRLTFSFLSHCSFLPVPLNVLVHYVKTNLPCQDDEQSTTKEIENEICRSTLLVYEISQNVETIRCHQVIRRAFQIVENTRPAEQREIEFVKMMKSLNKTLDFMDNTSKEDVILKILMRPHLQSFVDVANNMSWNTTGEFILISMKNGQFLFSTSNMPYEEAVKSLQLLEGQELGLSDESRCDVLANLGFYYLELDRNEDALNFLRRAHTMTEGKSDKRWLFLRCRILYNLARSYYTANEIDHAVEIMKESIDLAKLVYVEEEDRVMNRYVWLVHFHFSWNKCWKLGNIINEATEFMSSCEADRTSLSRARCLKELAYIYEQYCFTISIFRPWKSCSEHRSLEEDIVNQSLTMYKQLFRNDLSSCPEICELLATSAILKLAKEPATARTQLEKALEICIQNNDRLNRSRIIAYKKHLFNDLSWWQNLLLWVVSVAKGRPRFAATINVLDDILEDDKSGKISPSRRIIRTIKARRTFMVWHNILLSIFLLLVLVIVILF